jgi:hypothetical protein
MNWDSLQSQQPLSNLLIRGRVDIATLGVSKEVVQGVEAALSVVVGSVLTEIASVAYWIVNWSV